MARRRNHSRFRRQILDFGGVKITANKGSVSASFEIAGVKITQNTKGETTTTVSVPGVRGFWFTDRTHR